jgi:hypothetical protein
LLHPLDGTVLEDHNQLSVARSILPPQTTSRRRNKDGGGTILSSIMRNREGSDPESPVESGNKGKKSSQQLNTFNGVILPCVSNILGVIIFVRLRYRSGDI